MNLFNTINFKSKKTATQMLCIGFLLVTLNACNTNSKEKDTNVVTQSDSIIPPVIIKTGVLEAFNLNALPKPKTNSLSQSQKPFETSADFYVTMQNFNTAQGLALSSILYGFKDSKGNLWFGTSGNGVSKYDGKSFTNYSSSNGLIHNLIVTIIEDDQGNIWFGTLGGVSKFDGTSFENFTTEHGLKNNDINDMFKDSRGTIWFASEGGITKHNPLNKTTEQKEFTHYSTEDGVPEGNFYGMMEDKQGYLWFGYNDGVIRYNPKLEEGIATFEDISEALGIKGTQVNTIIQDRDDIIWIATTELICRYDPSKGLNLKSAIKHFTKAEGLKSDYIFCSIEDRDGNIWFGTKQGASKYVKANNSFVNFTAKQGLTDKSVRSITEDNSGSLWFGTLGDGLSKYDGPSIIEYTAEQGLPGKVILAMTEDHKGNLWLSPTDAGIVKFQDNSETNKQSVFSNYTFAQGFPYDKVYTSVKDKEGNLWFGGSFGLCKFNGKSITTYNKKQGMHGGYVTAMCADKDGNLWIGTFDGGVSKFNGESFTNFTVDKGLVHKTVWGITEDKNGIIWIATRGGLSRYDGASFMNFTKDQGLPDAKLSSVMQDKNGNILIGSWGGGISIIKKQRAEKLALQNAGQSDEIIFHNFSTTDGLSNNVIYNILEDEIGNIIIGTNVGFTILKGGIGLNENQFAKDGVENINEKTGYPIKDVSNTNSFIIDSKGIIWAGTGDKLVRFDYSKVHKNLEAPNVLIKAIKVNNEPISWQTLQWERTKEKTKTIKNYNTPAYINEELTVFDKKLTDIEREEMVVKFNDIHFDSISSDDIPENLILPFTKNDISFDFVGIETARPSLVRYQYMLEGYDDHWSLETPATTATFGNIFEGDYTFLLKAQSPDGVWSEPLSYNFKILSPWYRSWIAKFFYLLLFLASLFFIDRYQRERVLAKERQKTMQRELKHAKEIKTAYGELQSTQALLVQSEKMASLGELTAGIAHEIQNPLNFVNNFSEVSNELIVEMEEELAKGAYDEAKIIANDVKENLEKIRHHGKRAQGIVQGMLMHSRSGTGEMELTDINKLADEYLRLAYHGLRAKDKSFNATLNTDFDKTINAVKIIPQDIGRVILNLITNAFYVVDVKRKQKLNGYQPTVSVTTKKKGDKVIISVNDNGNGIPKEVIDKIFQPFFTTKPSGQGTGLGLSLSYDIVNAHGGKLSVDTKEGEGTTFTIALPKGKN